MLSAKVPLPVNRLCRVRQWLSEKVTALDAEQAALESKQMVSKWLQQQAVLCCPDLPGCAGLCVLC